MPSCENKEEVYGKGNHTNRNKNFENINQWQGTMLSALSFVGLVAAIHHQEARVEHLCSHSRKAQTRKHICIRFV